MSYRRRGVGDTWDDMMEALGIKTPAPSTTNPMDPIAYQGPASNTGVVSVLAPPDKADVRPAGAISASSAGIVLLQYAINLYAKTLGFAPIAVTGRVDPNTLDKAAMIAGLISRSETSQLHFWLTDAINKNATNVGIYATTIAQSMDDFAGRAGVILGKPPTNPYAPKKMSTASMLLIGAGALYFFTRKTKKKKR